MPPQLRPVTAGDAAWRPSDRVKTSAYHAVHCRDVAQQRLVNLVLASLSGLNRAEPDPGPLPQA
jgi:hypothetical protein